MHLHVWLGSELALSWRAAHLYCPHTTQACAHTEACTGGPQSFGEALLTWTKSFTNWDEAGEEYYGWFGWSQATIAEPCSWTGIICWDQTASLWLQDWGLSGEVESAFSLIGYMQLVHTLSSSGCHHIRSAMLCSCISLPISFTGWQVLHAIHS